MQKTPRNFIDEYVGLRLKLGRNKSGLSRTKLAEMIGLSVEHISDLENGVQRVSATKMWQLTQIFDVKVPYFFAGIDNVAVDVIPDNDV